MIQPCRSRCVIRCSFAETYSDTTADRRVRKSLALFERGHRDEAFEAALHADLHVIEREADDVNIFAGVNFSQLLAPSIRFIEYRSVVREHKDFIGRLYQFDCRRLDIAGLSIFQIHSQKIVSGARHLDEFVTRKLLDVLAAFRGRGINRRVLDDLQPRLRRFDFGFANGVLTRSVVQRHRALQRRHPGSARGCCRWTRRGTRRIHRRGTACLVGWNNRSRGNVFLTYSSREGRRRHCERRRGDGYQSGYPRRSKITMKHLPLPPLLNCALILAGAAYRASLDVARRTLMLMMRLLSFGEQKPFVDVVIDKIPRQQLVVNIMARDEEIGIGQRRVLARLDLAMNLRQLVPDRPRAFASRSLEPFEDSADAAIASRDHRLEIRLARRFCVELDLSEAREALTQHRDLLLDRTRVLHRIPLKRRPRFGHERVERDGHRADTRPAR